LHIYCLFVYIYKYHKYRQNFIDELSGKFGNLKVGPGGDAEGSFEIVDTIGQSIEGQVPVTSGEIILKALFISS